MTAEELLQAAKDWLANDPDPETRADVHAMIERADADELNEHFGRRLAFGTAGMRGALGPGPNRMNRAMVRLVSAGLADYLLANDPLAQAHGVVIGYDGRHGSRAFAEDAAAVFGARGLPVHLYDTVCPTPQLAHAVTWLDASAGVMVTASHNPPGDNGYKVYWSNGAQIIPPHDKGISEAIDALGPVSGISVPPLPALRSSGRLRDVPEGALVAYLEEVADLRVHHETGVTVVYTALHGVGAQLVREVLYEAGHTDLHMVPEQQEPDGAFPTVRFPNPEEPGALDLALALAEEHDADLVIANDPDADRLAVSVRHDRGYTNLTGNQIGVLLADDLLEHGHFPDDRMVATSLVSSTMLSAIASAHEARYGETLTGFKWIANLAIDFEQTGGSFVMGYEEALGYSVGSVVRDKDGVSAALVMVDLAAWLKKQGLTLLDRLEALYRTHGYYGTAQRALKLPGIEGAAQIQRMLGTLRNDPPTEMGGQALTRVRDLLQRTNRNLEAGTVVETMLPVSDVLHFQYGPDIRVLARPSGTEPKIKFYFEVRQDVGGDEALADVVRAVDARIEALADELLARVGAS